MHKTYTDTYKIRGFTGGHWSYASNTNETHGVPSDVVPEPRVAEGDRRLGVYFLGWESIEVRPRMRHHPPPTRNSKCVLTFPDTAP